MLLKTKFLRVNHANFVSKELTKPIMLRSKLRNKYLIEKSEEARLLYKKQRNVCVFLLKKAKKEYYENLDLHNVTDTKRFWKTVKPVFEKQSQNMNTISLIIVICANRKINCFYIRKFALYFVLYWKDLLNFFAFVCLSGESAIFVYYMITRA